MEEIEKLREQVEGTDPEEAERLSQTETVLKRAMMIKTLGENPALLQLRATLEHRISLCEKYLIRNAEEAPSDAQDLFSHALRQKEIATRKRDYEWFLKLFAVAEKRVENLSTNALGGKSRKK